MAVGLQLLVQSVPITTKVVSLYPAHGEVYSIQLYIITLLSFFIEMLQYDWLYEVVT